MRGLIFNLLAAAAERAGCADEAWALALEFAPGSSEDASLDAFPDDDAGDELNELSALPGTEGRCFAGFLQSVGPFRDSDWGHLPGEPVPLGKARPEGNEAPPHDEPRRATLPPPRR